MNTYELLNEIVSIETKDLITRDLISYYSKQITKHLDDEYDNFDWEWKYPEDRECAAPEYRDEYVDNYVFEEMERKYFENLNTVDDMLKLLCWEFDFDEELTDGLERNLFETIKEWFHDMQRCCVPKYLHSDFYKKLELQD